ncbi:MAG: flippase [Chloroflexota bacterium]
MGSEQSQTGEIGFFKGVLLSSAGSMTNIVVLFTETAIAVRLLETTSYGVYVLLIAIANFLVMGMDFGCKISVTQQIASSDKRTQSDIVNTVVLFRILTSIIMAIVIWYVPNAFAWLDPTGELLQYVVWLPAMFAFTSFDQLAEAMLKGFKQYQHVAIAQTTRSLLRLCLTILLLMVFELGILGVILSWVLSFAFSCVYQYIRLPIPKRLKLKKETLVATLRFGAPIQMTYFLWHISGQIQVVILSTFTGPASVAIFDVAAKIPLALQRFSESFISVYFPTMSTLLSNKQLKKAGWMLNQSLKLSSFIVGIGVLVGVLFSREIMGILFSAEYVVGALAFSIMLLSFHMMFAVNLLGYTLTSAGYPKLTLVDNGVRAVSSLVAAITLIPIFNFNGAAISRLVSNYAAGPVVIWLLNQKEIPVTVKPFVLQSVLLWAACLGGWLLYGSSLSFLSGMLLRLFIVLLFAITNFALSTVSLREIFSLIPIPMLKRIGIHDKVHVQAQP